MRKKINNYNKFIDEDGYLYSESGHKYCRWVDNVGYYQSSFRENGKKYYVRLHRLYALAFIPIPEEYKDVPIEKLQVNHIDGNKLNLTKDNLEWCINSENTQHGYDNNLYKFNKRSYKVIAINKNTKEQTEFKSIRECSKLLGVNRKTLSAILNENKTNNYDYDFKYNM